MIKLAKFLFLLLVCFTFGIVTSYAAVNSQESERVYEEAFKEYLKGTDYQKCVDLFNKSIPDLEDKYLQKFAYSYRAQCKYKLGDDTYKEDLFTHDKLFAKLILERYPQKKDYESMLQVAKEYYIPEMKRPKQILETIVRDCDEAIKLAKKPYPEAYYWRSIARFELVGTFDEGSISDLEKAISLNSKNNAIKMSEETLASTKSQLLLASLTKKENNNNKSKLIDEVSTSLVQLTSKPVRSTETYLTIINLYKTLIIAKISLKQLDSALEDVKSAKVFIKNKPNTVIKSFTEKAEEGILELENVIYMLKKTE